MSPPSCAISPMPSTSGRKIEAATTALEKLPSSGGKTSAPSQDKAQAQSAGSSSGTKREVGQDIGLPLDDASAGLVMVEHVGPPVRLAKPPSSAPASKTQATTTSVRQGVLDASGTTDKSSTDNLVGKVTIREADSSSDENDEGPTATGLVRTAADNGDVLGGSRRRAPIPSTSSTSLASKSSFLSSPKSPARLKKSVSFHQVHVQEYARTIGDHPDVVLGPPVSIDWEPHHHEAHDFDDYEATREGTRKESKIDMRIHPNTRNRMMLSAGVTKEEIKAATKAANRASSQRKSTVASLEVPVITLVEEVTQSLKRKIKRRSWRSRDAEKLGRSISNGSLSARSVSS